MSGPLANQCTVSICPVPEALLPWFVEASLRYQVLGAFSGHRQGEVWTPHDQWRLARVVSNAIDATLCP